MPVNKFVLDLTDKTVKLVHNDKVEVARTGKPAKRHKRWSYFVEGLSEEKLEQVRSHFKVQIVFLDKIGREISKDVYIRKFNDNGDVLFTEW